MKSIESYKIAFKSTDIKEQVTEFYKEHEEIFILEHSLEVAEECQRLAEKYNLPLEKAYIAGLIHDIGCVIPDNERIVFSEYYNVPVCDAESKLPMLLHQKHGVILAKEVFGIEFLEILSAIECHTTLKKNASDLDKLVFIADKVKWGSKDSAPYLKELKLALNSSLDEGCKVYLEWVLPDLYILHPWLNDAVEELKIKSNEGIK